MRAKSGDIPGAIADLNVIRKRAGAKEYTPDENLEEAIALERDKELFLEGYARDILILSVTGHSVKNSGVNSRPSQPKT